MDQAKQTPGPWRRVPFYLTPMVGPAAPMGWRAVAEVGTKVAGADSYRTTPADGRLVAAAPEPLAELRRLEWITEDGQTFCPSRNYLRENGHGERSDDDGNSVLLKECIDRRQRAITDRLGLPGWV